MKILLSIVARFQVANDPNKYSTTYWIEEIKIPRGQSVSGVVQSKIYERCRDFPRPSDVPRPEILSISHCVITKPSCDYRSQGRLSHFNVFFHDNKIIVFKTLHRKLENKYEN